MTLPGSGIAAPRLVLDAGDYAQRVLLQGGEVPWEPTAHARLLGQIGALLRPDLTLVDLAAYLARELDVRPALAERLSTARRATAALRSLLADEELAEAAVSLVRVVGAMNGAPVAVQIPSPGAWLATLAPEARDPEFDLDDAENAAVYVADWLRRFSTLRVDTVLLDGRASPLTETLAACGPLLGLAEHYRWSLGLRQHDSLELVEGVGEVLSGEFWSGSPVALPHGAALVLSRIEPQAEPEAVLDARARWR